MVMDLESPVTVPARGCPRRRLIRGALVAFIVLVAMLLLPAASALALEISFPDVPATHPYSAAILDLAGRGIISGYKNGTFGPEDPVLRQQFAKMVVLTGAYPVSEADVCPFTDVEQSTPPDLFPDHYVAVASAHGITVGTSPGLFSPGAHISRYQVISMVIRAIDDLDPGLLPQTPASYVGTAGWAEDPTHGLDARRAEYAGLLAGLSLSTLDPWGDMPRGEVAQVLWNMLNMAFVSAEGHVTDDHAAALAGIGVFLVTPVGTKLASTTTADDGHYSVVVRLADVFAAELTPEMLTACVVGTKNTLGYVDLYYADSPVVASKPHDATEFDIAAVNGEIHADFELALGYTMSGRVTDSSGTPLAGIEVYASPSARVLGATASTGPDGRYTISGLIAADYTVTAGPHQQFYVDGKVTVNADVQDIDFVLVP
jgi:hypothetical protein